MPGTIPHSPSPGIAPAQTKPLEMKWNELAPLVGGHRVAVLPNEGTSVKGEVVAVREDTILLASSSVKGYPKGSGSIPRGSIVQIDLVRARGAWGRTMGTVIGVLGGMTLGGYGLATHKNESAGAGLATFLGIAAAGSLAGFYAGRTIDKRVTHIKIVP